MANGKEYPHILADKEAVGVSRDTRHGLGPWRIFTLNFWWKEYLIFNIFMQNCMTLYLLKLFLGRRFWVYTPIRLTVNVKPLSNLTLSLYKR